MREFQYCVPTRILFGPRTEEQAGQAALAAGGLFVSTLSISWWVVILLGTICAFLTPLYQLLAFAWLLFDKLLGIRGSTLYGVEWPAILLFCLVHFIYFAWLHRRAERSHKR